MFVLFYILAMIVVVLFEIAWELFELLVKLVILAVTALFGRPTWVRF